MVTLVALGRVWQLAPSSLDLVVAFRRPLLSLVGVVGVVERPEGTRWSCVVEGDVEGRVGTNTNIPKSVA